MQGCGILVASHVFVDERLALLFCVAILGELLVCALIQRWCGNVEMAFLNDFRHETIEERHDKCVDVRTIDVGIGHDDNLIIA